MFIIVIFTQVNSKEAKVWMKTEGQNVTVHVFIVVISMQAIPKKPKFWFTCKKWFNSILKLKVKMFSNNVKHGGSAELWRWISRLTARQHSRPYCSAPPTLDPHIHTFQLLYHLVFSLKSIKKTQQWGDVFSVRLHVNSTGWVVLIEMRPAHMSSEADCWWQPVKSKDTPNKIFICPTSGSAADYSWGVLINVSESRIAISSSSQFELSFVQSFSFLLSTADCSAEITYSTDLKYQFEDKVDLFKISCIIRAQFGQVNFCHPEELITDLILADGCNYWLNLSYLRPIFSLIGNLFWSCFWFWL